MAGLEDLIQAMALGQKQQSAIAADDPYDDFSSLGQQTIQASLSTPGLSSRERIIGAILGGIGGGLAQGLSSDYRGRALSAYNDVLSASRTGQEIEQPSVLSPSIFAQAQQEGTIWKQLQSDNLAAEAAKASAQANLKSRESQEAINLAIAKGMMSADPKERAAAEQYGKSLYKINDDPQPISTPAEGATAKPGKSRGVEGTILDQIGEEASKLKELDLSPSELATARDLLSAKKSELDRQYKRVEEAQLSSQNLRSLADTAESATQRAGYTGTGGKALQTLSGYLGTVNADQANKFAAGQELESLKADIIKAARPAGVGAMSDPEMRVWLSSGVGLDKAASTNEMIIDKMRYASNIQDQYVDFMRTNQAQGTPVGEAEKQWKDIVKKNPFLVRDKAGTLSPNPLWQSAAAPVLSEAGAGTPTTATAPTPANVLQAIPAGYELTGRVDANGNQIIRKSQ